MIALLISPHSGHYCSLKTASASLTGEGVFGIMKVKKKSLFMMDIIIITIIIIDLYFNIVVTCNSGRLYNLKGGKR